MIDESVFHAALDDDPTNSGTRLVFADWLEEQGDPRAAGYRWMGENGKRPYDWPKSPGLVRHDTHDWYRVEGGAIWEVPVFCQIPEWIWKRLQSGHDWVHFASRRAAEEALCLALKEAVESRGVPPRRSSRRARR
jgi:uncharacterized protein (TIGR02996 family)